MDQHNLDLAIFAAHVKENAVALSLTLTQRDLETLNAAFPAGR